jgi:chromatin structure-remodeling complex subunit RSC4
MSKREHGKMNGSGESDGTRHKRRRDVGGSSSDVDMSDPTVEEFKTGELVDVKEDGLRLWQTVKDAVNKE